MTEDVKKVLEATKAIAEVCAKYHHFDKEKHNIICHEDCPFYVKDKFYDEFEDCRLCNYPFDFENEVNSVFEEEPEEKVAEEPEEDFDEPLTRLDYKRGERYGL